ncbi:hypothetical protein N566_17620 [Streptomycetaceae bacterium MP113-05]|nr:hypothetical protein N566_17620 [Streptomycetaceae bacterium MP113-05]
MIEEAADAAPDEAAAVRAAVEGELRLLEPEVRRSAQAVLALLHPGFSEVGASGRVWDRDTVPEATAPAPGGETVRVRSEEMCGTLLAPGVVHLTYVSDAAGRRARRSSVWRETGAGWRLWFHQGTPLRDAER